MTHEEKIEAIVLAFRIGGFYVSKEHLDLVISIYKLIEEKGKSFTHKDVSDVITKVINKRPEYNNKNNQ